MKRPISIVENRDCMEAMKGFPDKFFELAVVDPEYGIDAGNMQMGSGKNKLYKKGNWDLKRPSREYFIELMRVSRSQIIFGGNFFADLLPVTGGWIFWDKLLNKDISFGDGELAWCSLVTVC